MAETCELDDMIGFALPGDVALRPDGSSVAFTLRTADREADRWVQRVHLVGTASGERELVLVDEEPAGSPKWSPCGRWLSYVVKSGAPLRLRPVAGGPARSLLEGYRGVGQVNWAPDGRRIAFTAMDPVPAAEASAPVVIREVLYKVDGVGLVPPMRRHLYVADVVSGAVHRLTGGDFEVNAPAWSPDGARISFASAVHPGREFDGVTNAFTVDLGSGAVRQLTDWQGTVAWTAWQGPSLILAGQHRPGPNRVATLFRLEPGAAEPEDLLSGFDRRIVVSSGNGPGAVAFLPDGRMMFCARERGCTFAYTVNQNGGRPESVVTGDSTVVTGLSAAGDGSVVALSMSDASTAGDLWTFDSASGSTTRLTLLDRRSARPEVFDARDITFGGPGRVALHGYLMRGVDRGDGRPPPLLVDVHGGPDNAWRPNLSPFYLYRQVLCARGWNVLLLNPRGSDGYGEEFMRSAMGRLGHSEEEDFLGAVNELVACGLADGNRLAVMGSSHGGFMANWLTARTTRFAAAVSTACIANWASLYGTSSTAAGFVAEQMGGTPQEAPEQYASSSPLTYARSVSTPTLLVHGEDDMLNPIGQSEEWYTVLRRQGCEVEFVRYPKAGHLFMYNGRVGHQLDYARRVVDWLVRQTEDG